MSQLQFLLCESKASQAVLLQSRDFELHNPDVAARLDDSGLELDDLADHGVCGL